MTRWWRDTLFKRLFLLIWGALVVSHLAAWFVVTRWWLPPPAERATAPAAARPAPPLPPLGTLPPTPGLPGPAATPRPDAPPAGGAVVPGAEGGIALPMPPPALPPSALLVDYGIRALLIALAAWWGARWVSRPVRRMVSAAGSLEAGVVRGEVTEPLDESAGTAEVREAARVYNQMAARLAAEFRSRALLIASISHDLRTPLTRMRMRLESLLPAAAARRCVDDIREMNELIDGAITVFRNDPADDEPLQPTDVYALVQSLTDDLAEQGQPVSLQGQSAVVAVKPAALKRAVSNLIGNALRYGGSAELTVITIDGVRIFVDDRGPGIPGGHLADVFRAFHRLDPSRSRETGGAGLGLHIARELLHRQGATLTLANRAGGGLRAEIRLASG